MGKKVIIDCDVGVDDALALILAFHSRELEVKAVTGVNGNVPLDLVFDNIKRILSFIEPDLHPFIARGAAQPLRGHSTYAYGVHGEDGLGGARIEKKEGQWWKIFSGPADKLFAEMARQNPDQITLIATGPLTNLALGIERDREGMGKLRDVVIMGGAVRTKGNITPYAEFNIFNDPLAAKIVFESGLPITLVPLDVTHQVFLTPGLIEERVRPLGNPFSRFAIEAMGYDLTRHRFERGTDLFHLHDPLAVGVVINPDLVKKERLSLQVEAGEGDRYGFISESDRGPGIEACLVVNSKAFLELFLSRL
jgi:purine nucleosidase